jgi:hypothetical protein
MILKVTNVKNVNKVEIYLKTSMFQHTNDLKQVFIFYGLEPFFMALSLFMAMKTHILSSAEWHEAIGGLQFSNE